MITRAGLNGTSAPGRQSGRSWAVEQSLDAVSAAALADGVLQQHLEAERQELRTFYGCHVDVPDLSTSNCQRGDELPVKLTLMVVSFYTV